MKPSVLERAKHIIDLTRYENEQRANENKSKALCDPSFKSLYNEYVDTMIMQAKTSQDCSEKLKKLASEIDKKLKSLKIGSIEPIYSCKKCSDSGFVDGKYCSCLIKEVNNILIKESGFEKLEDFKDVKFDIFEDKEYMQSLYQKMQKWCHSNFEKNIIFISGNTGVGKSHLTRCMANELINENYVVFFTTSFAMHQDFVKSHMTRDLELKNSLLDRYLNADILFIDDLGTELRNPLITINYLYHVINERKINKRPTIITSNLDLYDLQDYYDERISSRIIDKQSSICLSIQGEDLRLKKV